MVFNLEKFNGKNDITIANWCNLVDAVFSVEEWTGTQKVVIASLQLSGAAATWYDNAKSGENPPKTWPELKNALVQRFGGSRSAAVARLEIARLRWREEQDLEEHIAKFMALRSNITNATEDELVSYLRQTLPPDYLSDSLYRDPKSLNDAIAFARSLRASRLHGHYPIPQQPRPAESNGPSPMDLDVQQLVRALHSLGIPTKTPRTSGGQDNRKCYYCGNRGHIARFCRQKQANNSGQQSFGQRRFQQPGFRSAIDARTYRLAELAYQIEQQQQQPHVGEPEQDEPGKGSSQ
jgi:hypothetical protein